MFRIERGVNSASSVFLLEYVPGKSAICLYVQKSEIIVEITVENVSKSEEEIT